MENYSDLVGQAHLLKFQVLGSKHPSRECLPQPKDVIPKANGNTAAKVKAAFFLIVCGMLWGATPTLSKLTTQFDAHPIGLALLVNIMGAVVCLSICYFRGKLSWPNRDALIFYMGWAVLYSVVNQVLIYWLSARIDASFVSIITVLEGFAVFAGASLLGLEKACWRRCFGMSVGLIGVGYLIFTRSHIGAGLSVGAAAIALLVPLSYASESLYIAARKPTTVDPLLAVAFVMTCSVPMLAILAFMTNDFIHVAWPPGRVEGLAFIMMAVTLIANVFFFHLIASAGSVFAGQVSYSSTFCGIGWSVIFLGEKLTWTMSASLGIIVLGLVLMQPQQAVVLADKPIIIA